MGGAMHHDHHVWPVYKVLFLILSSILHPHSPVVSNCCYANIHRCFKLLAVDVGVPIEKEVSEGPWSQFSQNVLKFNFLYGKRYFGL